MGRTGKERQAELAARKRAAGQVQVAVWVPLDRKADLLAYAKALCDATTPSGTPPAPLPSPAPLPTDDTRPDPKAQRRKKPSAQIDLEDLLNPGRADQPEPEKPKKGEVDPDRLAFGSLIRDARKAKGWGQPELAKAAGLSRSAVGNIETGRYGAGPDVRAKLLAALDQPGSSSGV